MKHWPTIMPEQIESLNSGLLLMRAGEEMEPTIRSDDLIFVDPEKRSCINGGIFAIEIEGEVQFRRMEMHLAKKQIRFRVDNPLYHHGPNDGWTLIDANELNIVGRAVGYMRELY